MGDFYEVAGRGRMGFDIERCEIVSIRILPLFMQHGNSLGPCSLFSEEDDNFIRESLGKLSYRQIGLKLGRTRNSISGRVNRLGLSLPSSEPVAKHWVKSATESRGISQKIKAKKFFIKTTISPKPRIVPLPEIISSDYLCSLMGLSDKSCRWPIGHPNTAEFKYCGVPEAEFPVCSYCRYHRRMSYSLRN